ncbi:serine and arginine rich splicing factor 7a isoform X2 [Colossoma macropomum]|uniref:serine and arginine rich splicing factor 7a isoform X2 n=1 Tax=Colossoma macropomum TaxID=42526 RepID=UPI0018646841|nr:serine and arginine rich splicing factor 7a isoform X2 [Colossoma macropomum]
MTVATSAENVATTPTTATATTREAADAAGLGPGPVVAATLAAVAMSGDTVPHPTPDEGAGHHPRAGPDPDRQSGVIAPPCADPEALLGGPERQSAGAVVPALVPAPAPDRARAARPDPAPVPAPPAAKETAVLGLPAREPAPHQTLTDEGSTFHISTSSSVSLVLTSGAVLRLIFSLCSGTIKSPPLASCSSPSAGFITSFCSILMTSVFPLFSFKCKSLHLRLTASF